MSEQTDRVAKAEKLMDRAVASGKFNRAEIPSDISETTCQLLEAQVYFAEGDTEKCKQIIYNSYRELKIPIEVQEAFNTLGDTSKDRDARQMHTNNICIWLDDKYRDLAKKRELPKREIEPEPVEPEGNISMSPGKIPLPEDGVIHSVRST